jgi:hypothetical protein
VVIFFYTHAYPSFYKKSRERKGQEALDESKQQELTCNMDNSERDAIKQEVMEGLTARQKRLPCKYFYDAHGSYLFEQICRQPEYYQTRTELRYLSKPRLPS